MIFSPHLKVAILDDFKDPVMTKNKKDIYSESPSLPYGLIRYIKKNNNSSIQRWPSNQREICMKKSMSCFKASISDLDSIFIFNFPFGVLTIPYSISRIRKIEQTLVMKGDSRRSSFRKKPSLKKLPKLYRFHQEYVDSALCTFWRFWV